MLRRDRRWTWFALFGMVFGIPALACGGRAIGEGSPEPTPTSTAITGAMASGGTSTGSGNSAPFGPFPCTASTAWYYSCQPLGGTSGCKYATPIDGNPAKGWMDSTTQSQAPGCQLEIVAPTDMGGTTCATTALCLCDATGTWVDEHGSGYCPNN